MARTMSNEHGIALPQWEGLGINLTMDNGNLRSWTLYERDSVFRAALYISDNYLYVLTSIGVPCNLLSFLVLRRIKPVTSAIFVMMILAVSDSLKLCVECINTATYVASVHYTDTGCSFLMTARSLLQYYPIWLVLLLTLERVVAVCFPLKANTICTLSNARRSVIFLLILDCIMCIVRTFIYEVRHINRYGCYVKYKYQIFYTSIWLLVDAMFFVMIPLTLLFLGNIAIIIKLQTSREIYSSSDSALSQERKRQNKSVTGMLLAVCITTFVCLTPNTLRRIPEIFHILRPVEDIRTSSLKYLATTMIRVFTHSSNAVNFFLYILSGSRFRALLREMITSWFGMQKNYERR